MKKILQISAIAIALICSLTITTTYAADPAVQCEVNKLKTAGRYLSCRLKV